MTSLDRYRTGRVVLGGARAQQENVDRRRNATRGGGGRGEATRQVFNIYDAKGLLRTCRKGAQPTKILERRKGS